jgi:hypothetical protein
MNHQIRFAVIGDTHYVQPEYHKKALNGETGGVTEIADIKRNYWMTLNVLPKIIRSISELKPDFIIQTGDHIHGHCDDEASTILEMSEAHNLFSEFGAPIFYALGTHDGVPGSSYDAQVKQLIYPAISNALGKPVTKGYYKFTKGNSLFVVLDYTSFVPNDEQVDFIREALRKPEDYEHTFVFAHPPLIPVGRPFFTNYDFVTTVKDMISQFPIDAYFCGHTHNQVASLHKLGQKWIPQLKGSILGYPDETPICLAEVRPILPDHSVFEHGWSFLEDSAPGWWLVTIDGTKVQADWYVLHKGVMGQLTWDSGMKPTFTKKPIHKVCHPTAMPPVNCIKSVRIRAAGSNCKLAGSYNVFLNEHFMGSLPRLEYFDCRQFLTIDSSLWPFINLSNRLRVTTAEEPMCIGGIVIEIETNSGWIRSNVSPYYTNTTQWDMWNENYLEYINPGAEIQTNLNFGQEI